MIPKRFVSLEIRYNSGIATEFRGARDHDSMFEWASKAGADSVIKDLKDSKELDQANGAEEVVFLYLQRVGASRDESVSYLSILSSTVIAF